MSGIHFETVIPVVVSLAVLIWGLRLLSATLLAPVDGAGRPLIASALTEKNDPQNGTSFSRVAGAIGSIGLASFVTGLGIWVFFALNNAEIAKPPMIEQLSELWPYIGAAGSLFAPYAFNQLSAVFGGGPRG
ncbi:hypothetical protein HKX54_08115 [Sulfitobacter sp. M57]|uniref:hypothetical protein n=1 Tax=unclassified Sulfitobacter TaxID=196795 RepID=UPI0023E16407|nr:MULTISPECIES: hypothetical protein [unclassified Sulfitobacter]MDF3414416.1 hypothetical protein [Sulfitobacter sp. KE5]MDF3421897.1 hypothetical protein [Sulfitobacter sp. KE43]MDF3432962.1 hypothetical protein [Sulfitobacter sp. KE42]MDF3458602.1 hypothetical protein [Sulfitobacter sp. S74]MDF3462502.1 hypothetical protein [Sulfitobacter sp. Ks18]